MFHFEIFALMLHCRYIISCYIIGKFGVTLSVDITLFMLLDVVTLSGATGHCTWWALRHSGSSLSACNLMHCTTLKIILNMAV